METQVFIWLMNQGWGLGGAVVILYSLKWGVSYLGNRNSQLQRASERSHETAKHLEKHLDDCARRAEENSQILREIKDNLTEASVQRIEQGNRLANLEGRIEQMMSEKKGGK